MNTYINHNEIYNAEQTNLPHFIILSGNYCSSEISAEFGKIPPAFLPLGNKRLYTQQLKLAKKCSAKAVITIPANYKISQWDLDQFKSNDVRVIRSPSSLSLNDAVQYVLEAINPKGPIYILYGDTLIEGKNLEELDCIATHKTQSHYHWAEIVTESRSKTKIISGYGDGISIRTVVCGFFSFSDFNTLRSACISSNSFDDSVTTYNQKIKMKEKNVQEWHDFGHLNLAYQSRRNVLVSRSFNHIWSDGVSVIKSSSNHLKIKAEAKWYESLPPTLRIFTPQYLGSNIDKGQYQLEYLYLPTLAELFTFGELPVYVWRQIIKDCLNFIQECWRYQPAKHSDLASNEFAEDFFHNMFRLKSKNRVDEFLSSRQWNSNKQISINNQIYPPIEEIIEELISLIRPTQPSDITVWHGDFFFGNILYDFRASRIRVIDPRGGDAENRFSVYGDRRYDLAKLAHSIIGGYDCLLSNFADIKVLSSGEYNFARKRSNLQLEVEKLFLELQINGKKIYTREIAAMTALLFLTMLPLHSDDEHRQDMLLCTGLTLAINVINGE